MTFRACSPSSGQAQDAVLPWARHVGFRGTLGTRGDPGAGLVEAPPTRNISPNHLDSSG